MRLFLLLFASGLTLWLSSCNQPEPVVVHQPIRHKKVNYHKTIVVAAHDSTRDTLCIAAVGDIMLGSSYPNKSTLPPDSARGSFNAALPYLKGADVVFGNLEGTLLDSGAPASYKKKLETAYLFRMPTRYGKVLKDAGFNLLSVANNHITDFNVRGYTSTIQTLDSYSIHYAGLDSCPTTIFKVKGVKYGFCAFAPNAHTVPLLELRHARHIINDLRNQCDIVIVSFHGGAEGPLYEHVPFKMESYLNGKRGDVHLFAHTAIDAGADIVLGNGPHVSRAFETYKGHLIAYSLGNFCTYKCVSISGVCGMAPLLKVYLNKKGEFLKGNIIAFRQSHETGLVRDTLNHVVKRIKYLTEKDFPESGLDIDDDGSITIVE